MALKKRIALSLSSPVLAQTVKEQLALMAEAEIAETDPDLVICDAVTDFTGPQLLLGKATGDVTSLPLPLRLGAVTDQVRYLLSNRTKMAALAREDIDLGAYVLETDESQLVHKTSGTVIRLTDKERLFLLTLYDAEDHSMDRKGLLDAVWGYAESAETHTLETHLYRLRQKMDVDGEPELIVSGDGLYRLKI
jgi:DNA-binding response OmpR family regulator